MISGWRLVSAARLATAFDGEGSYRYGNRWIEPGTRVVYLASTTSLAALEVLAHAGTPDHLTEFMAVPVAIPQQLVNDLDGLPADWRQSPAPLSTRRTGTAWANSGASAVLRVPSVIVPWEFNFVVNVIHPGFAELELGEARPFRFDRRL